ncbi:efflux RND transporter periplasmic adaptor subunit [Paludisphaera sp.]|uniref:efflux RND transporter periplasmic adaptor subunit n=1 Tax=Paludisphaera sp. TaxID=2017432 RepID=UPI00301BED89
MSTDEARSPVGLASDRAPGEPLTRRQKIRLVVKVIELRLRFIALMAATGAVFAYWDTLWNYYEKWTRPPGAVHVAASEFEFFCPMHPTVVQGEPGSCPICGMPLSKRKKGEKESLPEGVTSRLTLSSERIAQAGIETVAVDYRPLTETVTTVGSVAFDERRLARISSKTRGMARVEQLFVNFTGTRVEAGEPLAELYSPELYQTIRELLIAQQSAQERSRLQTPAARQLLNGGDLVGLAREKLARWGITSEQVDEILAKGKAEYRVPILSPISGVVVRKNVVEGQYVAEGESMFEVADLSRVWILAKVYEDRLGLVQVGQAVEATVRAYPGEVFKGTVAFKAPALDPTTRTLDVRYDLDNPDGRLRPGMYATVTLKTPVADMPAFRARLAAGRSQGDLGRLASLTVEQQERCLVTNAKLGSMGDPLPVKVAGKGLWICCAGCEAKLEGDPTKYLSKLAPAPKDGVLTVPESAVIDTGTRQVVFIEAEPGVYEGREVVLGPSSGDLYPVLEGLAPGDKVAAAGSFLLDAETRLKASSGPEPAAEPTAPHEADRPSPVASSRAVPHPDADHRHE